MLMMLGLDLAMVVAMMVLLWLVALKINDVSFIDAVWGAGMSAVTLFAWWQTGFGGGRGALIAAMAILWGLRLGIYLFVRWRGHGEDPRYAKMLRKAREEGRFAREALTRVFLMQALLLFFTSLPAQAGVLASGGSIAGPLAQAGVGLWLLGMVFETVGDWQLTRFRANPANKGKVLDSGLWRYTRHPNYFGDACAWWGIWLAAAECGWEVAAGTAIGPLFLTYTLTRWSGKPLLEKGMAKTRPGYAEYIERTPGFVPWFPKRK